MPKTQELNAFSTPGQQKAVQHVYGNEHSWACGDRKNRGLPRCQVEKQPATQKIVATPFVASVGELILKTPFLASKVCERNADMALALIRRIVDGDNEQFPVGDLPGEDHETIMSPVSIPAGAAIEKLPMAIAKRGSMQDQQKSLVKAVQIFVEWLGGAS